MFVRGKKKFVHDCEFTLNIAGVNVFTDIKGEVKLSDVTNHSEDDDFEVIILTKCFKINISLIFLRISNQKMIPNPGLY